MSEQPPGLDEINDLIGSPDWSTVRRGLELLETREPLLWQQCTREIWLGSAGEYGCAKVEGGLDVANLDWSLQETAQLWVARRKGILDEPDVKRLLCSGIVDSSPLAGLHHLQALHIDIGRKLTEVAPLATLDQLESLTLIGCENLSDISVLEGLQRLERLNLQGCQAVTELGPLSGLGRLKDLDLSNTGVRDLGPIAGLTDLRTLRLKECSGVTDLSPLVRLVELETLELTACCYLRDLRPISGLDRLSSLSIQSTEVCDLEVLRTLKRLHTLEFGSMFIDLGLLTDLDQLRTLRLFWCHDVEDLSPLASLTGLKELQLDICESLTNLSPLVALENLQTLWIDNDGCDNECLESIAPLAQMRSLETLVLGCFASLSDLAPLGALKGLRTLHLTESTALTDISVLAELPALQVLNLNSTAVDDLGPLSQLHELTELNLDFCRGVHNLDALTSLGRLRRVSVRRTGASPDAIEKLRVALPDCLVVS